MKKKDRKYIDEKIRADFSDSLDIDAAMVEEYPHDNRWDYLLGHENRGVVVGVEPHSAKQAEVSTVIAKKACSMVHLRPHLAPGKRVAEWIWVASGNVEFADTEKTTLRLAQKGILFAGKLVKQKHLP